MVITTEKVNAIILAGTGREKKLIDGHDGKGPQNKGLVKINNQPMVLTVLQALRGSEYINQDKIAVVGPKQELEQIITAKDIHLRQKQSFIKNCVNTYDYLSPNGEKTLFVPCDLPFIDSRTINTYLKQCSNYNARFYFSVINTRIIPQPIKPLKKNLKLHLREIGYYRTANLVLFQDEGIENRKPIEDQIRAVFESRRVVSAWSLLKAMGNCAKFIPDIIKHYLPGGFLRTRGLREEEIEKAIERKLHMPFKLIEVKDWRAFADVDYQEDYEFFLKHYEQFNNEEFN